MCAFGLWTFDPAAALADAFSDYAPVGVFDLPAGTDVFDVLGDGRIIALSGEDVYVETTVGSRMFGPPTTLPEADMPSWGPAFIRVSPDGAKIAVGNNGGSSYGDFKVGVFDSVGFAGSWFSADHYEAQWYDSENIALSTAGAGASVVTVLDVSSDPADPVNPTVIDNIGGASAGVAFDEQGNLYTGNGYSFYTGASDTGWIKSFDNASWTAAMGGGPAVDFEGAGTLIADLLTAAALGFDAEGNLHVGGGDLYGGSDDYDYAALVRRSAVQDALAGEGPADPLDSQQVRKFDPEPGGQSLYDVSYNPVSGELYLREGSTVHAYAVPEPGSLVLLMFGLPAAVRRRRCN